MNVVELNPKVSADEVFDLAKGNYSSVLVMGYDNDGNMITQGSDISTHEALWLIEQFKLNLMGAYDD